VREGNAVQDAALAPGLDLGLSRPGSSERAVPLESDEGMQRRVMPIDAREAGFGQATGERCRGDPWRHRRSLERQSCAPLPAAGVED
jgi:hypothetical protein